MVPIRTGLLALVLVVSAGTSRGVDVSVNPVADAFLSAAHPSSNYGGGGALSVAAPGLGNGEFQTLMRFDLSAVKSTFDSTYGAGQWTVQGATLRLQSAFPNAMVFNNPSAAGDFAISWVANDGWTEGTGNPSNPGTTGITFGMLSGLIGPSDEPMGVYAYDGSTITPTTYTLTLSPGLRSDVQSGGLATLRLFAAPAPAAQTIAYVFNSRTQSSNANWPVLMLTAEPTCPPDFNHVGGLSVQDIFDFLGAWFAGDLAADFDHGGALGVQDIFDFLGAWFAGC